MKSKVKFTKASKNDKNKFTVRASQLGFNGSFLKDTKIVLTVKNGRKSIDVVVSASRNGTTFYGSCPRDLKMPSVGRPVHYSVVVRTILPLNNSY